MTTKQQQITSIECVLEMEGLGLYPASGLASPPFKGYQVFPWHGMSRFWNKCLEGETELAVFSVCLLSSASQN